MLGLRKLDRFNKYVGLVSTHIVKILMSRQDTNLIHKHKLPPLVTDNKLLTSVTGKQKK